LRTEGLALIYVSASSSQTVERVRTLLAGHYEVSVRREPHTTEDGLAEVELYALTTVPEDRPEALDP
ncbi:hypothetical protein, partial [Streptomyces graminilatus]|uniref:hypothetical protein n=1 Tax=Streptomyces graminilatus TaxID=1464070 RepID=UPI000AF2214A